MIRFIHTYIRVSRLLARRTKMCSCSNNGGRKITLHNDVDDINNVPCAYVSIQGNLQDVFWF
jgi:hypothetical protein